MPELCRLQSKHNPYYTVEILAHAFSPGVLDFVGFIVTRCEQSFTSFFAKQQEPELVDP